LMGYVSVAIPKEKLTNARVVNRINTATTLSVWFVQRGIGWRQGSVCSVGRVPFVQSVIRIGAFNVLMDIFKRGRSVSHVLEIYHIARLAYLLINALNVIMKSQNLICLENVVYVERKIIGKKIIKQQSVNVNILLML